MTYWVSVDVVQHLWQSTLFAGVVWAVAHALRAYGARVRYWLWVAASIKFLIPLSWLIAFGALFEWDTAPTAVRPVATFVIDHVLVPEAFAAVNPASTAPEAFTLMPVLLRIAWAAGVVWVLCSWWRQWRPIGTALRDATPISLDPSFGIDGITVMTSSSTIEPGMVGIWRPVLLLPNGLIDRLTPAQVKAVILHEQCHARHHDNLFAAMHMLVEALFWFHPLVWWIERRMVHERERGCDEAVLDAGSAPQDYAEGILEVCRSAIASPLVCVAGVSGSDLRRRIESIIVGRRGRPLTFGARLALGTLAITICTLPIVAGAVQDPVPAIDPSLQFEVASIKRPDQTNGIVLLRTLPGRFEATNLSVRMLLRQALRVPDDRIVGAPGWIDSERYTVTAKVPDGAPPTGMPDMLTNLMKDRFKLVTRTVRRELPIFNLVLARSDKRFGPGFRQSSAECQAMVASRTGGPGAAAAAAEAAATGGRVALPGTPGGPPLFDPANPPCGSMRSGPGIMGGGGRPISFLVQRLSQLLGRPVIDKTALTGLYDFTLTFAPDPGMNGNPSGLPAPPVPAQTVNSELPNLYTAVQEQLGLKLESQRGPVDVVVIDRLERPTVD